MGKRKHAGFLFEYVCFMDIRSSICDRVLYIQMTLDIFLVAEFDFKSFGKFCKWEWNRDHKYVRKVKKIS